MCTVGIDVRAPGLVKSAEASDRIIVIDGCPVSYASKTLELAGFKVDRQIVISEFGIKKPKRKNSKRMNSPKLLKMPLRHYSPSNLGLEKMCITKK